MMAAEKTTLKSIKSSPKMAEQHYRPSDFLSQSDIDELHEANARGGKISKPYDEIDAFEAEILARFGWQTYKAYLSGEADIGQLAKYIAAERARDAQNRYNLECIIVSSVAGANRPRKHGGAPQSLKKAIDIVKAEYKRAKGAQ
jgi:hypothetical protein